MEDLKLILPPHSSYNVPIKYPFKNKKNSIPLNDYRIDENNTAVIIGGGPGGLLSAFALHQTQLYSSIYIIEKRGSYSRNTAFNLRPQCFAMFKKLGLLNAFSGASNFVPSLRFHQMHQNQLEISEEQFTGFDENVDYSMSLSSLFKGYGWPHHAVKINDFEKNLSQLLFQMDNIYFLHGVAEIIDDNRSNSSMKTVRFKSIDPINYPNITIENPELIVIAEGARSITRDSLVGSYEISTRKSEHWFTASVSLEDIQKKEAENNFTVLEDQPDGKFIIAGWLPKQSEMLINGNIISSDGNPIDLEKYIKESAYRVIHREQQYLDIMMPSSPSDLSINSFNDFLVKFLRAKQFSYGDNLVFIGDAAGTGSPLGGYGITFLGSVYVNSLIELASELRNFSDKESALKKYCEKVNNIITYWQSI